MKKLTHVYVRVSEHYRRLREVQTFLNRLVWSTELCYGHFLNEFENEKLQDSAPVSTLFNHLPIQAWYKNKKGTGKYNLSLREHKEVVRKNQAYVCRSAIILFNSYFDDYLKNRANTRFRLYRNMIYEGLDIDVSLRNIFKADCCREIRNIIVHKPAEAFLDIKDFRDHVKRTLSNELTRPGLLINTKYTSQEIHRCLSEALHEVIGCAIIEMNNAIKQGYNLPFEYFFMLYTFTNYNDVASELEQALFYDKTEKSCFNRVALTEIHPQRMEMITEPSVVGKVYGKHSNKPVFKAEVRVVGHPFAAQTDSQGEYFLSPNLKNGYYKVSVDCAGYKNIILDVQTVDGKTVEKNIELEEKL